MARLHKLGIHRPFDLVLHLPLRYEDETQIYPIAHAPIGTPVLVEATVVDASVQYRPRRMLICQLEDGSGAMQIRFLNFYGSQLKSLQPGVKLRLFGEMRSGFFGSEMIHPRYRIVNDNMPVSESLTPVYSTTAGMSQATLRKLVERSLDACNLEDSLPEPMLKNLDMPDFETCVRFLHGPPPDAPREPLHEKTHAAWRRLKFDELLAQQLSMRRHYARRRSQDAPQLPPKHRLTRSLQENLPFQLTPAQHRVFDEISHDMACAHPMQRLLQGDVGSGKTIVAALAALQAVENSFQAAVMAPTEILAEQHFLKFRDWLTPLGIHVVWIASNLPKAEKTSALEKIASGEAQIAVGTHALFQDQVTFARLGLAVIDEQHRFGVHQRLALRRKGGQPHQLMMSATPIPRTLAMSYYADLDVSVIDELPPGRTPVATRLVDDNRREEIIHRVREACLSGKQAYWVCPLIEESEKLQLQTALDTYETLVTTFPDLRVGLVHGRMPAREKAAIMAAFKAGEIQLLVATTVIEVGVDVPNASLMVIDHAERMGLSQLHQLRGRVGRGSTQSQCILLFQAPLGDMAKARLKVMYETTDGFEIARQDMTLRGPGEILGSRQSGVPLLRVADIPRDQDLLDLARNIANEMLKKYPKAADKHLYRWLGETQEYLKV